MHGVRAIHSRVVPKSFSTEERTDGLVWRIFSVPGFEGETVRVALVVLSVSEAGDSVLGDTSVGNHQQCQICPRPSFTGK